MINDKIALIKSTPQYTEFICSPKNFGILVITAAIENQVVQISFPRNPFKDGVVTKVLVGGTIAVKALLEGLLYSKGKVISTARNMTELKDFEYVCFNDKKDAEASMLALEEVLPSYRLDDNFMDYTTIFHEFVESRMSKIPEYMRDIGDGACEPSFVSIAHHILRWLTASIITSVRNVRELAHACKLCDAYFCRSIKWLLSEVECYSCDADPYKLPDYDAWFKECLADHILSQYCGNGRIPVWKLLSTNIPLCYIHSAEIFKAKLKLYGVDIHYIK